MKPSVSFTVDTRVVRLSVAVQNGAVTAIRLRRGARRRAQTAFEKRVERQLREYGEGKRASFTFPVTPQGSAFDQKVWNALRRIPYGRTATYGQIARRIGKPSAARAVGAANGRNPIPIVIPCHRVVSSGGKLGGYGGGLALKRRLLDLEAHRD
jgi:methylated-DNA-[protein]-cysteine S-methyltransferase